MFEGCRFVGKCAVVFQFPFVYKFLVNFDSGYIKTNECKTDNKTGHFIKAKLHRSNLISEILC